jgi:uncharacterized protein (TIGR03435 family)
MKGMRHKFMRRACRLTAPVILAAGAVFAQSAEVRPVFEVASVKLNNSGSHNSSSQGSQGQLVITNQSLKRLVERAYNVKSFQVTGPDWMDGVHLDIAAKYPPDAKREDQSLMLRSLLEDRFKLAVHRKPQDLPGFALTIAKGGFKLKPVPEEGGNSISTNGGRVRTLTAKQVSIAQIADFVARNMSEMVADQTGIKGVYNFEMRWTNDDQKADDAEVDVAPSLFTALQETLGLRLKPDKIPSEIIVVDHVERVPVEN